MGHCPLPVVPLLACMGHTYALPQIMECHLPRLLIFTCSTALQAPCTEHWTWEAMASTAAVLEKHSMMIVFLCLWCSRRAMSEAGRYGPLLAAHPLCE